MKSKSAWMLLELSVMFLVFSIAAALCLKAFFESDRISKESFARDNAVVLSQNAAELLKENGGDLAETEELLRSNAEEAGCVLLLTPLTSDTPALGKAEITVLYGDEPIFTITAAWQEETEVDVNG